jgi:GcrA cell cycle regulator
MIWTDERVEWLKRLWADGVPASAIAEKLGEGVTRNAVIGRVHRLKLPGRAPTPVRFRKARTGDMASARLPKKRDPAEGISITKRVANPLGWRAKRIKPKPEPRPVVRIKSTRPVEMRRNVGLLELGAGACRWPVNEPPRGEPYLFCGATADEPRVYCPEHCVIAYQRGSAPRRPELGGWTPREEAA